MKINIARLPVLEFDAGLSNPEATAEISGLPSFVVGVIIGAIVGTHLK